MKKSIVTLLVMVLLLNLIPAYANEIDTPVSPDDPSEYISLSYVLASLVSSNGKALCYSSASAGSTHRIYMTVKLQRLQSGSWTTVKTWTSSATQYCEIEKSWYVASGYYYRNLTTVSVYTSSGSLLESASAVSPQKWF